MNAAVDKDGKKIFVKMGSYGIGVSRLVGALIEANFDEKNEVMKWPVSVSPFECAIICFASKNDTTSIEMGIKVKNFLEQNNIETVLDDSDENFSGKLKKFNLIGIPFQILIGKNPDKNKVEFKEVGNDSKMVSLEEALNFIKSKKIN